MTKASMTFWSPKGKCGLDNTVVLSVGTLLANERNIMPTGWRGWVLRIHVTEKSRPGFDSRTDSKHVMRFHFFCLICLLHCYLHHLHIWLGSLHMVAHSCAVLLSSQFQSQGVFLPDNSIKVMNLISIG
jgi:hypothetical protein